MSILPIQICIPVARTKTRDPSKNKGCYHGAYPAGFLEAAREILVHGDPQASIWHIPGGRAKFYNEDGRRAGIPLSGYGMHDITVDINPDVEPDIVADVRKINEWDIDGIIGKKRNTRWRPRPDAIIIDRDYSREEAAKRNEISADHWPENLKTLTEACLKIVKPGGLVGVLDWEIPRLSTKKYQEWAYCPLMSPGGSRARVFTVWREIRTS